MDANPVTQALSAAAVNALRGGVRVFAGQRDDPFFVDLGSILDLAGLRPFNSRHLLPLPAERRTRRGGGYNTHSIAMQMPMAQVVGAPREPTVGIYASASRPAGADAAAAMGMPITRA